MPRKNKKKSNKNEKKNRGASKSEDISIVGPSYVQLLQGSLYGDQEISLVVCGETHEDAIDVTRRSGRFTGKDGWIDRTKEDSFVPLKNGTLRCRIVDRNKKDLPFQKAKEWGKGKIKESEEGYMIILVLLWVQERQEERVAKGKTYIVELTTQEHAQEFEEALAALDEEEESGDDDDDSLTEAEGDEDDEDLEKLHAEIKRMEEETARLTKETEELEKKMGDDSLIDFEDESDDDSLKGSGGDDDDEELEKLQAETKRMEEETAQLEEETAQMEEETAQIEEETARITKETEKLENKTGDDSSTDFEDESDDDSLQAFEGKDDDDSLKDFESKDDDDSLEDFEGKDDDDLLFDVGWIDPNNDVLEELPNHVRNWVLGQPLQGNVIVKSSEWGDLDAQAFALNQRRMYEVEGAPTTEEFDTVIRQRKEKLKEADNIWTWDDWFAHVQSNAQDMDVQLILEASIPPWELTLHRPSPTDNLEVGPAADCIRKMEQDEEPDEDGDLDPNSDGTGSYLHYIYRRFMDEQMSTQTNVERPETKWLHCADVRDLGSSEACQVDSVRKRFEDLLHEEEIACLKASNDSNDGEQRPFLELEPDSSGQYIKFVPEPQMNPERKLVETLREEGTLGNVAELEEYEKIKKEIEEEEEEEEGLTFPSIEAFLGQNSDNMYYSKHVKLCYSPFMVKCVQSLENWDKFFTTLFFGGSVSDALSLLKLEGNHGYTYVRSNVQQLEDGSYQYRGDTEGPISHPFFPSSFCLCAKDSDRTWTSDLYARICQQGDEGKAIATSIQDWWLQKIHRNMKDPKGSGDASCGGEWFEAYLYAVHRDIYDDIDPSEFIGLLKKKKVKSLLGTFEEGPKKHDIGKIKIPSCQQGFDEIVNAFSSTNEVNERSEVLAKILIDIYTSQLVDIAVALKVAEIAKRTEKKKVFLVLYLGSVHTREVANFFVGRMGFKQKTYVGKVDYKDNEVRKLQLPSSLWNPSAELFSK